ncbi:efflux RND transporter periplasmic adaptor subunit [Vibrio sp. JC009]|uniref:efflux RND transporter periplasmic adaptor subunit n=1 Tax=Vibrio sp. JC009 TaxID=2912314 RepID=UPI0023AEFDA5|nr:efflux RND transporter periplasmic adaptor subunit [Vibrio sp. JC009]WED23762.1 efflux RND transporter periplasmic adaptor subunit [Vibrio sp. JC009]
MKLNPITITITLISASAIFGAAAYNGSKMPEPKQSKAAEEQKMEQPVAKPAAVVQLQKIAVQNTSASSYQAEVTGYGEAHSKYELSYTSEVSGRVKSISKDFETGMVVKKGTILAKIDDTSYQQALANAKADVAQAKLDLLEEQREAVQAKSEWERSGLKGEPDSPLVLHEPQLENAKATLQNAEMALKTAQQDLDNTIVKAPFDALIVTTDILPGSYIQTGTQVATLYSIDNLEIEIPLSGLQWANLPQPSNSTLEKGDWTVTLTSPDSHYEWQGYVDRSELHLNEDTRQRSIVVVVDKPLEQEYQLLPGTFVQASIPGNSMNNLWELPSSAVSQQGNIWTVNSDGLLTKSVADVQFAKQDKVYVSPVTEQPVAQVVKRPLSSFQANMKVTPVVEGDHE